MPCVSRQEESKSSRPRPRSARTMLALRSRSFSTNSATRVSISWLAQWGTWAGKGGRDKKVKVVCLQTTYLQGILRFPDVHSLGQNQVLRQLARIDHYKIVTDDILKQRNCKALLMELLLGGHQEIGLYGLGVCKYKQKPKDKDSIKYVIKIFFFSKMAILG